MKIAVALIAGTILAMSFARAKAQDSTQFYGPAGQYEGEAVESGNSTQFYGAAGQYEGQAVDSGNDTQYYGPAGQYEGQSIGNGATTSPYDGSEGEDTDSGGDD